MMAAEPLPPREVSTAEQNQASAAAENKATGDMAASDLAGPRSGAGQVCGWFL